MKSIPINSVFCRVKSNLFVFIRFLFVAFFGYSANIAITIFLTEYIGLFYLASYLSAQVISFLIGFYFLSRIVFYSDRGLARLMKYFLILLSAMFLNIYLVKVLTEIFDVYYIYSIIVSTLIVVVSKFIFYRIFVFV